MLFPLSWEKRKIFEETEFNDIIVLKTMIINCDKTWKRKTKLVCTVKNIFYYDLNT